MSVGTFASVESAPAAALAYVPLGHVVQTAVRKKGEERRKGGGETVNT